MTEPNTIPFTAEFTFDLPAFKEVLKGFRRQQLFTKLGTVFVMAVLFLCIIICHRSVGEAYLGKLLLFYFACFWGMHLFRYLRDRNGPKDYRQLLDQYNGKPMHLEYTFLADGIHILDTFKDYKTVISYDRIRSVFETENYVVCVLKKRESLQIDKRTICGGPVSTFTKRLLLAAPNLKRKKLKSLLPGKILEWIFIVFSVVCVILALNWLSPELPDLNDRVIDNTMDYRQIARELEPYGITGIPEEVFQYLEDPENHMGYYTYYDCTEKCIDLLSLAGMGTYDAQTGKYLSSQCGVYWFDSETYDLANMYTNLLSGIRALDKDTLDFTDLREDISDVNWENGTGTQRISFTWNGNRYTLSAEVDHDWYDISLLNRLNSIVREETGGKQLYFAWDRGQGFLVFFGDAQWARQFEAATGIPLQADPYLLDALF